MSTFEEYADDPDALKKVLFELDIGLLWKFWTNYNSFTWYMNVDGNYPSLPVFTPTHGDIGVENIGSVLEDSQPLTRYTTIAGVVANAGSFYFDIATKNLYIHCSDDNKPATHIMFIGVVYGFSYSAEYFNDIYYEPRLEDVSAISTSKDPLYFGKFRFNSFNVKITNNDGAYDLLGEDFDVFGNRGRVYFGYEDIPYEEYKLLSSGFVQNINITDLNITITLQDERRRFSRSLPSNVFDTTTYPDIKSTNANKVIPLAFGTIVNAPVICTNEDAGLPVTYSFKLCDTEFHEIKSIDTVYVNGVVVVPNSTDTTTAIFTITSASGDYTAGDDVTCDFVGYIDDEGAEIENGLTVVRYLLEDYYGLTYNNTIYNQGEWNLATLQTFDIGIFITNGNEIFSIIEEIANTIQADIFYQPDGRLTAIKYNPGKASIQSLSRSELLTVPSVDYDPTEVTTSTTISHTKDWAEDTYLILSDKTQESTLFLIHKTYINKAVETLLTSAVDAQTYSDTLLDISGVVKKIVSFSVDISTLINRNITDFIDVPIVRQTTDMIGDAKCEIITLTHNLNTMESSVECRIVEIYEEIIYQDCITWDGDVWDGDFWGDGIAGE
jgi:hypothetical protein